MERRERVAGAVYGLLVGDALGVPYEFQAPGEIPESSAIEMEPPSGFPRAHAGVAPGTWSDDGAHALCLLASLLHCGRLDLDDFGNGALMRVLPLALWHLGTDEELVRDAMHQSLVTHGHPRSQVCCALYCLWARRLLEGSGGGAEPFTAAVASLRTILPETHDARRELEAHVRPEDEGAARGTGYVVDCLRSARHALGAGSYEAVVRAAIRLGNDTDTTACVAGGLAGVRDGMTALPARWLSRLRGRSIADPLVAALVARVS